MKILLVAVNAKYIHSNLAVQCLRAYAKRYAANTFCKELTINHSQEDILKEIYKEKADIVAFSCYIWNISMIESLSKELRKVQPGVKIWFGGPEVSYDAVKHLKENRSIDGIMIGEGEQTFLELAEHYVDGTRELSDIMGLAYRESAELSYVRNDRKPQEPEAITVTSVRQPIALDEVPFPYDDLKEFENRIIYYESSRGCPFSCSYCLSSIDKGVRLRSLELVRKELKFFLDAKVPQVKFVDRTFNCNKKHAMDIWRFVKEHDNGITNFHFEISADILDEEEIEFLATLRPGQVQFEIGVQSTNGETIEAIHRKMDLVKLFHNVGRIREGNNIHQHLDLIAGLPLEDYKTFQKSFDEVYSLRPDQLQLGFLKVLKGSSMEMDSSRYGITFRDTPPYEVLYTEHLSYDEVLKIKGVCDMVEVYYNSAQFTYSMEFLGHFFESPMKLFEALSNYYEAKGAALVAHSRMKRYDMLLEFYQDIPKSGHNEEKSDMIRLFEEILLLDLYLREAMKSRPGFAPDNLPQSKLREFYGTNRQNRNTVHIEHFDFDVFTGAKTGKVVKKEMLVLFDYADRDPLNKAAKLSIIKDEAATK